MTDDDAVTFLLGLVQIQSETGDEGQAVQYLTSELSKHGIESWVDEAGNGHGKKAGHMAPAPELMFLGHIDTVPGQVPVRIEDGRLYGRGAVDAKGPLATAAVATIRAKSNPSTIRVIGAVGEEGPSHGARHLLRETPPQGLLIGEPGGTDSIVLGYKGSLRASIRFEQESGHSAGATGTACDAAVAAWSEIQTACARLSPGSANFETLNAVLLDFSSGSDGLVQWAELRAGFRLPPELSAKQVESVVQDAAAPGIVTFGVADEAYRARKDTSLVASLLRSLRSEEVRPRFKFKTGTSDMNVVAPKWGVPTAAYGPGDSSLDHTPNEHIVMEEYLRAIRVLTRVFEDWR